MKKFFLACVCLLFVSCIVSCADRATDIKFEPNEGSVTEHTHTYTSTVIEPSCDEKGYTLYSCSLCDEQYSDLFVQELGHSYADSVEDAFCDQYQKKVYKCSVCDSSYEEALDVQGTIHEYVSNVTYPDRENGGYTTHQCKRCSSSYVDGYTDPVNFSTGLAYTQKSGKYYVSGLGSCEDTDVVIPSVSEKGYQIAGIMKNAFANSKVTSVTVLTDFADIQSGAFYDCAELRSVTLPQNALPAEDLFFNNPRLTELTMPMQKPLAYYFEYISSAPDGYKALTQGDGSLANTFYGAVPCSLREVNILSAPCASVLSGCDMVTKVTIPSNATSIGASAFRGCTELTEFLIPDTVRTIGAYAFAETSITSITIPKSVSFSANDQHIFEDCAQLREVVFLSQTKCLPSYTFANCAGLTQIKIPDSVTTLGAAFISGTGIESITLPDSLTSIEANTFYDCNRLTEVILPQGLKTIEYGAFKNCIALKQIDFPSGLEKIGHEAFMGCTALEKAILPASIQEIEYAAFKNCTSLKQVELPSNLKKITEGLFFGCSGLAELTLPLTVTTIQTSAFEGSGITSIVLPEGITSIGARVFADCASLISVTFSSDSTPLANDMFLGATSLETLTIPKNITAIPARFCKGATSLKAIIFPTALTVIGDEAFMGCTAMEALTLPQTLRNIGYRAFKGCAALASVDFSDARISSWNSTWEYESFADCTSLTETKNYNNVEYINVSVFRNTPIQTTENGMTIALGWLLKADPQTLPSILTIPQGVTKISDYVFSGCKELKEVTLPEGVLYLGMRIFGESDGAVSLIKLTLPDSLSSFSTDTIYFLPKIEELVVGKGLQTINGSLFGNLTTLRFRGTIAEFEQMPWRDHSAVQNLKIICTDGKIEPT